MQHSPGWTQPQKTCPAVAEAWRNAVEAARWSKNHALINMVPDYDAFKVNYSYHTPRGMGDLNRRITELAKPDRPWEHAPRSRDVIEHFLLVKNSALEVLSNSIIELSFPRQKRMLATGPLPLKCAHISWSFQSALRFLTLTNCCMVQETK